MPPPIFRQAGPLALICTAIACSLPAGAAFAQQLSGSAGLVSDYMYRGVSLSAGKPAARLTLDFDAASGWFAGGQVVSGQLASQAHRNAQWLGYAGYAQRLASGLSWEAGMSAYAFHGAPDWNFREAFAGLSSDNYSLRLHYSPDYLGVGQRTVYAELNGGEQLSPACRLFWRAGYLSAPGHTGSNRAEGRMGIGTSRDGWQWQLSLDAARLRSTSYGGAQSSRVHGKLVLGLTRSL